MDRKQQHLYRLLDLRIVPCVKINKEWCGSDRSFCKLINVWGESCPLCFWVAYHFESTLSKLFFHVHRIHPRLLTQSLSRSLPIPRRAIIIFLFIYMFVRVFVVFVVVVVVVVFFLSFLLLTLTLNLTAGLFLMTSSHAFEHMWPIAPCKGIQIPEFREIFASGIRNLEVWNLECSQEVRNLTKDWNPESQFHRQRKPVPVSGIRNPESMAWNPESKTVWDSVAWGDY